MARVTVEDAVEKVGNRFDLILLATRRARQIATGGKTPKIDVANDKPTVTALREIEQGLVTEDILNQEAAIERQQQEQAEFDSVATIVGE